MLGPVGIDFSMGFVEFQRGGGKPLPGHEAQGPHQYIGPGLSGNRRWRRPAAPSGGPPRNVAVAQQLEVGKV